MRLLAPKKISVRPTTSMAKEALFNIIANQFNFSSLNVLDLFGGIGSISFEFSSRGCKNITIVEANRKCADFITKTATKIDCELNVFCTDVFKYLGKNCKTYDFVFADPPFDYNDYDKLITLIFKKKIMNADAWFVLEHSNNICFNDYPYFTIMKKYGNINFSIFKK